MQRFSAETKRDFVGIAEEAKGKLLAYGWPGNVRELANAIERAVVPGQGPMLELTDLPPRVTGAEPGLHAPPLSYRKALNACRRGLILKALDQHQGNRAAAARALDLHEKYLLRLIKSLRIN